MSSTGKGTRFEKRMAELLEGERVAHRLPWQPDCCKVFPPKRPYYSKDREKEIIFDVAVEVYLPGSDTLFMAMLVECKDLGRPVGVEDVEEFFAKVQQVGAARTKAVVATRGSFQEGAIAFARSKGIGLLQCVDDSDLKWILHRTPGVHTGGSDPDWREIHRSLASPSKSVGLSRWNCCIGNSYTTKLHEFFVAVAALDEDEQATLGSAQNHVLQAPLLVERLYKRDIEARVQHVLAAVAYSDGNVRLEDICSWQHEATGLAVRTGATPTLDDRVRGVLGRIHFDRHEIVILAGPEARQKFTLAHELGHLFLGHCKYIIDEYCERSDFEQREVPGNEFDPIRRMEWQANYFASCLLLPRAQFSRDFFRLAERHGLQDRGHGWLYVDQQRINQHLYHAVTSELRSTYKVSRRAVTLRLKDLGVLEEAPPLRRAFSDLRLRGTDL